MSSQTKYDSETDFVSQRSRRRQSERQAILAKDIFKPEVSESVPRSKTDSSSCVEIRSSLMSQPTKTASASSEFWGSGKAVLLLVSALFVGLFVSSLLLV